MFGTADQYTKALNIIGAASFVVCCSSSYILLQLEPTIASGPKIELPFAKVYLPVAWLGGAFIVSIVFRIIKLHDCISDLLGIREVYDIQNILIPAYRRVLPDRSPPGETVFAEKRRDLMKRVFYYYAPGPPGRNVISDHLVAMAWESLCWLWLITEAIVIAFIFGLVAIYFHSFGGICFFFGAMGLLVILYFVAKQQCRKQTKAEVEAILETESRRSEIRTAFNEILG